MKKTKVLISGCAGFVGRHITKRFVDLGYDVTGIDNISSESALYPGIPGFPNSGTWPEHLKCDFKFIQTDVKEFFKYYSGEKFHFDIIIHLAAVVGGRLMIDNSPLAVAEDLAIDAMMFDWAVKTKPDKIVYFSSSAAYPIGFQTIDYHEKLDESLISFVDESIGMPDMSYGWSKLTGEYLARLAHEKYGLNVICYRPFSGYGEDQHETYPFPAILNRALNTESPITVWSDTIRDFIYIEDCIDGVLATMESISDGSGVNLGTGVATSFSTLAKEVATAVGYMPDVKVLNDKPSGVFYRVADTTLMNKLGYKYSTSLKDGIDRIIKIRREK